MEATELVLWFPDMTSVCTHPWHQNNRLVFTVPLKFTKHKLKLLIASALHIVMSCVQVTTDWAAITPKAASRASAGASRPPAPVTRAGTTRPWTVSGWPLTPTPSLTSGRQRLERAVLWWSLPRPSFYPADQPGMWSWPSGKLPIECQKIAKNWHFSKNLTKIVIFFNKIANGNFVAKKKTIFVNFFEKCHVFGNFLTFNWQFSGGSGQNGNKLDKPSWDLLIYIYIYAHRAKLYRKLI